MPIIYSIQKGDCAWKVAERSLKAKNKTATSSEISAEMKRLAKANGYDNVKDFSKVFAKIGNEINIDTDIVSEQKVSNNGKTNNDNAKAQQSKQTGTANSENTQQLPPEVNPNQQITKNSPDLILKNLRANGHSAQILSPQQLPQNIKAKYDKIALNWESSVIIKDMKTGELHIFCEGSKYPQAQKNGLESCEFILADKPENNKEMRYYKNGKIVCDSYYKDDEGTIRHKATITNQPTTKTKTTTSYFSTSDRVDITSIDIDPKLLEGADAKQRAELKAFIEGLKSQKEQLKKDLGLDNETYYKFCKMAIGIAIQEQGLETGMSTGRKFKKSGTGQALADTLHVAGSASNKVIGTNFSTATSKGLTSIKVGDWNDDPKVKKLFDKYGIGSGYYDDLTGKQSAAATIIVLKELQNQVRKSSKIQNGMEAANGRIYEQTSTIRNGKPVDLNTPRYVENRVTEDDAILYLYNGRRGTLTRGDATPADNIYTNNVNRFMKGIQIKVDAKQLQNAKQTGRLSTDKAPMTKNLGWGIGQVAFRTDLYNSGIQKNTNEEINKLKTTLKNKNISDALINEFIKRVQNGNIAFVNGLTAKEMKNLYESDIKLLIKYSDDLNKKLQDKNLTPAQKRALARSYDRSFKTKYLAQHAQRTNLEYVQNRTIKLNTQHQNTKVPANGYGHRDFAERYRHSFVNYDHKQDSGIKNTKAALAEGRYRGFMAETDKGVNTTNSPSPMCTILAQYGSDVANTIRTSGQCIGGTKLALWGAGLISEQEKQQMPTGSSLAPFLAKHPDRFIEITHIQISETQARQITAGDISSLPAGCIVVFGNDNFTDEKGKKINVPGHAGITNGNGQINSDETDNSNWDNFASAYKNQNGKGEHGWVRVFIPNPNYYTVSADGKQIIKK